MSSLNRLEELQPYVIGVRYFQGTPVIDVVFKDKWVVPDSQIIEKEKGDSDNNYYMFFSRQDGVGIDELLNHVEAIIELNIEKEKKNELFKVKIEELKVLFQKNSLSKLQNMKFVFNEDKIISDFDSDDINFDTNTNKEDSIKEEVVKENEVKEVGKKNGEPVLEMVESEGRNGGVTKFNKNNIELPPKNKNGKVILEDFSEPKIVCKCGPNDVCPICEDNK